MYAEKVNQIIVLDNNLKNKYYFNILFVGSYKSGK